MEDRSTRCVLAMTAAGLGMCLALSLPARAADGDNGNRPKPENVNNDNNGNNNQPRRRDTGYARLRMGPDGMPLPSDKTRSTDARLALEVAKEELTRALGASSMPSTHAIENELWRNDEYRQAVLDMRRAHNDYDAVRKPIFDALRNDTYYRELERKKREKEKVISSLVLTGRGSFDWLLPHAMAALEVRKRMTREQIMALAQTPEVEDARQRLLSAAAKVRSIKASYTQQAYSAASAKDAKALLDAARDKIRTAQLEYNAAAADEAEYERLRDQWIAELRRTGRPPTD